MPCYSCIFCFFAFADFQVRPGHLQASLEFEFSFRADRECNIESHLSDLWNCSLILLVLEQCSGPVGFAGESRGNSPAQMVKLLQWLPVGIPGLQVWGDSMHLSDISFPILHSFCGNKRPYPQDFLHLGKTHSGVKTCVGHVPTCFKNSVAYLSNASSASVFLTCK